MAWPPLWRAAATHNLAIFSFRSILCTDSIPFRYFSGDAVTIMKVLDNKTVTSTLFGLSAFCIDYHRHSLLRNRESLMLNSSSTAYSARYPTSPSQNPLIPWVWDAVYDGKREQLDVTVMVRDACHFNRTRWHEILSLFPQIAPKMAYGDESQIILRWFKDDCVSESERKPADGATFGSGDVRLVCEYFQYHDYEERDTVEWTQPVYVSESLPIVGNPALYSMSTIQVRCPLPSERLRDSETESERVRVRVRGFRLRHPHLSSSSTDFVNQPVLPFCVYPHTLSGSERERERETQKSQAQTKERPGLSLVVCTASARGDRRRWSEWIEHHRLLGVQHFYVYDTTLPVRERDITAVQHSLSPYIREGLVSLTPWHFDNCMRPGAMASGRALNVYLQCNDSSSYATCTDTPDTVRHFFPPRAVAQTAALASCYTRVRSASVSRYVMHIDDDEFVSLSPPALLKYLERERQVSLVAGTGDERRRDTARETVRQSELVDALTNGTIPSSVWEKETERASERVGEIEGQSALVWVADRTFSRYPEAAALNFIPVLGSDCRPGSEEWAPSESVQRRTLSAVHRERHRVKGVKGTRWRDRETERVRDSRGRGRTHSHSLPPRLSDMTHALLDQPFVGKLLMRADKVDMFFVHYLSLFHPNVSENRDQDDFLRAVLDLRPSLAALTHIRRGYWTSPDGGDIFGEGLPMVLQRNYSQCTATYPRTSNISEHRVARYWYRDIEAKMNVVLPGNEMMKEVARRAKAVLQGTSKDNKRKNKAQAKKKTKSNKDM